MRVEAGGGRLLRGRSLSYGESTGYGAFAGVVRQAAGIFETDQASDAREKLALRMRSFAATEAESVIEAVAVIAGLSTGELENRSVLFDAARRFVEALGSEQPTVLGFEDLHWAEATLLDLVEYLAARVRDVPVLLLASARPELFDTRPSLGGGLSSYTALPLDALNETAAEELTRELLKDTPSPPRCSNASATSPAGTRYSSKSWRPRLPRVRRTRRACCRPAWCRSSLLVSMRSPRASDGSCWTRR